MASNLCRSSAKLLTSRILGVSTSFSSRSVHLSAMTRNKDTGAKKEEEPHSSDMHSVYKVDRLDRWILKNYSKEPGKYKTLEDVPDRVRPRDMDGAKSRFRIRWSLYMMGGTVLACLYMIFLGKRGKPGESVEQQNLDRHRGWQEERKKMQETNK